MSHFTRVKTQFKNKESLVKALQALGLEPETPTEKVRLRGPGKVYAMVRVGYEQFQGRYHEDLGFVLQPDGTYETIYSPHDLKPGRLERDFLQRLSAAYAKAEIKRDGTYEIVEELGDGRFSLRKKVAVYEGVGTASVGIGGNDWSRYTV